MHSGTLIIIHLVSFFNPLYAKRKKCSTYQLEHFDLSLLIKFQLDYYVKILEMEHKTSNCNVGKCYTELAKSSRVLFIRQKRVSQKISTPSTQQFSLRFFFFLKYVISGFHMLNYTRSCVFVLHESGGKIVELTTKQLEQVSEKKIIQEHETGSVRAYKLLFMHVIVLAKNLLNCP